MTEAHEPWMTDAEIKHAVIGMLTAAIDPTAAIDVAAGGEIHPGVMAAFATPLGIEVEGSIPTPPLTDAMTREEIRTVIEKAVQDTVREVGSHYRRLLLYMITTYQDLAAEALAAGVDVPGVLRQRALAEDDPPLPF